MPYTLGFDPADLADHFTRHGHDVGATTKEEYEALADEFLGAPRDNRTQECTRSCSGDILRFRSSTKEFGILASHSIIRTYYKPHPHGPHYPSGHNCATNQLYFRKQCTKP